MLPTQTIEELLSVSHVSAIVACAGAAPGVVANDYGVDVEVRRIGNFAGKRIDLGSILDLQLKASIRWSVEEEHIVYDLDADAYNRLVYRRENSSIPCALVLCCLPEDAAHWLKVNEDELVLAKCCYFHFIDSEPTANTSSIRIRIPRCQLLTPESLGDLIEAISEGAV
jgi:hypothetical protein